MYIYIFIYYNLFLVVTDEERENAEENGDLLTPPEDLEEVLNKEDQPTENGGEEGQIEGETNNKPPGPGEESSKQRNKPPDDASPATKPKPPPVKPKQSLLDPVTLSWEETKFVLLSSQLLYCCFGGVRMERNEIKSSLCMNGLL